MSRKSLINILENIIEPISNRAFVQDILGSEKASKVTLVNETVVNLNFSEYRFLDLELGAQNITINATCIGMKDGEKILLRIKQAGTARTITWGTGIKKGAALAVTATASAVDLFEGMVLEGAIVLKPFLQAYS